MSPQFEHKRRQHFIKKDFQARFIIKFCLLVLAGAVISTLLVYLFTHGTLTSSFKHSRLVIRTTAEAILPAVLYTNLITLGLISLASIGITLFVSHKIAGPMYRMEEDLKVIARGDLKKKIRFRRDDQMTPLAESVNAMTASLNGKLKKLKAGVRRLSEDSKGLPVPGDVVSRIEALENLIDEEFKIQDDEG